jgi:hypothetical protein
MSMDDNHNELVFEVCRTGRAYVFGKIPHEVLWTDAIGAHLRNTWTGEESYAPWKIITARAE